MELAVNVSLNDCQATNIRDWPSNARLPPSSSSYMPRYRLTSIGGEKLSPWSRETDTNVASAPEATKEFQKPRRSRWGGRPRGAPGHPDPPAGGPASGEAQ